MDTVRPIFTSRYTAEPGLFAPKTALRIILVALSVSIFPCTSHRIPTKVMGCSAASNMEMWVQVKFRAVAGDGEVRCWWGPRTVAGEAS